MTDKGAWVRTGVDGDGNCFFHSYVYSLEPTRFRSISYEERLKHVMTVKKYFSSNITKHDIVELIDVNNFEFLTNEIEKWIHPNNGPDLSNQPLLSIKGYVDLLYISYPHLKQDEQFQSNLTYLYQTYHKQVQNYTETNGTWMFDSLIHLFMKKMDKSFDSSKDRKLYYWLFDTKKDIPNTDTYFKYLKWEITKVLNISNDSVLLYD